MKTILTTVMICIAIASGIKHFSATELAMATHKKQVEVAMTSIKR